MTLKREVLQAWEDRAMEAQSQAEVISLKDPALLAAQSHFVV